jgi:hypothetical protein
MQPGRVTCSRCGWVNQQGDRMCGGCGQPLSHSGAPSGSSPDNTPTVLASSDNIAPPPLPPETRTAPWQAPPYNERIPTGTATVAASPSWAAPPYNTSGHAQPRVRPTGCLGRTTLSLVIAAVLLAVLAACGWAAVVRPAMHASVDQRLRSALAAEIDKVPVIPDGFPSITRMIPESAFNNQASASNNSGGLQNVYVHLRPGAITMTYTMWGRPGSITTHLLARDGRIFVQGTRVTGLLAQVENGDELQDALNESLARIPAQDYVERLVVGDGTLTVTLRHA